MFNFFYVCNIVPSIIQDTPKRQTRNTILEKLFTKFSHTEKLKNFLIFFYENILIFCQQNTKRHTAFRHLLIYQDHTTRYQLNLTMEKEVYFELQLTNFNSIVDWIQSRIPVPTEPFCNFYDYNHNAAEFVEMYPEK